MSISMKEIMFDKYHYYTISLISDKFGKYLDSIQKESWKIRMFL